jgi:hypothetical protein
MQVSVQLHAPTPLPVVKSKQYPLKGEISRPQNRSGRFGKEKNLFPLQAIVPRILSFRPLVAQHA